MNEASGANTIADSKGVNTGTVYGGAATGVVGKLGNAISFDGVDDYVDIGNDGSININPPMTWEAWVNTF